VIYIGASATVANGVKALRAAGSSAQVVTLSNNASEGFIKLLGEHARGVVVTQVFPNERAMTYRLIQDAQELATATGMPGVSPAMLEGFAAAKVLVEGCAVPDPSRRRQVTRDALEGAEV
jgi:ABC-type branched-subunit amino acid transport system substrate-binding protein